MPCLSLRSFPKVQNAQLYLRRLFCFPRYFMSQPSETRTYPYPLVELDLDTSDSNYYSNGSGGSAAELRFRIVEHKPSPRWRRNVDRFTCWLLPTTLPASTGDISGRPIPAREYKRYILDYLRNAPTTLDEKDQIITDTIRRRGEGRIARMMDSDSYNLPLPP
jgi:hypothetical protein